MFAQRIENHQIHRSLQVYTLPAHPLSVCVNGRIVRLKPTVYKGFVWELLDRVIHPTLYGNPLDISKRYAAMNDEIKLTYLLFSMYLSVLCSLGSFGAILSGFIVGLVLPVTIKQLPTAKFLKFSCLPSKI